MLLVLKSEGLMMNYHRFFHKMLFIFYKKCKKKSKKYLICIFIKTSSSWEQSITKMISAKNSTNPESFSGFGRGRQIDRAGFHGLTLYSN
jgi:hypothetical protein